ncbi:hypothetical protein TrCOL_g8824 [Triparma columacea]|uniref:Uncharacterized protein n=1 Tax=Triparma columacea TaxID=722753 RepID=A0A9W7GQF5_9STRA|nr:hypothetical protein TrCOL_g8824 [Triparma columacea]
MSRMRSRQILVHNCSNVRIDMSRVRSRQVFWGGSGDMCRRMSRGNLRFRLNLIMQQVPSGNLFWSRGSHCCHNVSSMWGGNLLLCGGCHNMHDLRNRQILWGRGSDGRIHMQQVPSGNLF